MSVSKILKGAGKKVTSGIKSSGKFVKDELTDMGSTAKEAYINRYGEKVTAGPGDIFQRLNKKRIEEPDALFQQVLPYQLNNKYVAPIAGIGATAMVGATMLSQHNKAQVNNIKSGEGLSAMTEGGIHGASANVITPGLKQLNDNSSAQARQQSANIRDNMETSLDTWGAEGDIVFALHNMR